MKVSTVAASLAVALVGFAAAPSKAAFLSATNNTPGIFDSSSGTRTVILGGGTITDVNIQIHFSKCDDAAPATPSGSCGGTGTPFFNEIHLRLTSPGGTDVELIPNAFYPSGSGGGGIFVMTFDQDSSNALPSTAPQTGTFRPVGNLDAFDGQDAAGTWTLLVEDTVGADQLGFYSYTLSVTTSDGAAVPEPASLALLGAGLLGLGALRRRRD